MKKSDKITHEIYNRIIEIIGKEKLNIYDFNTFITHQINGFFLFVLHLLTNKNKLIELMYKLLKDVVASQPNYIQKN